MIDVSSVDAFIAQALAAVKRRDAAEHQMILDELERGGRLRIVVDPLPGGAARVRVRLLRLEGRNKWIFGSILAS